jgi:hypothetical protein
MTTTSSAFDRALRSHAGHVPGQLTLIDLLYAPAVLGEDGKNGGESVETKAAAVALRSVAKCLAAVEGLAHCLAWTSAPVDPSRLSGSSGGVVGALASAAKALNLGHKSDETTTGLGHKSVVGIDRIELPRLGISFVAAADDERADDAGRMTNSNRAAPSSAPAGRCGWSAKNTRVYSSPRGARPSSTPCSWVYRTRCCWKDGTAR